MPNGLELTCSVVFLHSSKENTLVFTFENRGGTLTGKVEVKIHSLNIQRII